MNIFSAKYKAHRLVNYVFYIIVFAIGFLVGLGLKKIDFKKINLDTFIPVILTVDKVEAYTIISNNYRTIDEEFIVNYLEDNFSNFDINNFPNIYVYLQAKAKTISSSTDMILRIYAFDDTSFNTMKNSTPTTSTGQGQGIYRYNIPGLNYYYIECQNCKFANSTIGGTISTHDYSSTPSPSTSSFNIYYTSNHWLWTNVNYQYWSLSNFNLYSNNDINNVLDFSSYTSLSFDEDLFENDSNFKKVCVNNYDTFSITSNEYTEVTENNITSRVYHSNDFIWFPNGVKGLSTYLYDTEVSGHVTFFDNDDGTYTDDPYGWWFWLNSKEEIDTYWNSPNSPGLELVSRGYTDKYKYYNWTFYPFMMTFTETYRFYQVFWFKDTSVEYLDGEFSYPDKFCFYIKNIYDVNILTDKKNQFNDFSSSITVLGGLTFDDQTFYEESQITENSTLLFSNVNNFITQIRSTINFINSYVYDLYLSMPLLLRMFILTILTLFITRFIINMIVR